MVHSKLTTTKPVLLASVIMMNLTTTVYAAGEGVVVGTTVNIKTGAITTNHIADKGIQHGDLAENTLTHLEIGTNAIGADELGNASVDTTALQEGAVVNSKIANGTIQGGKIQANTITNTNIALGTLSLDRFDAATQTIIKSSSAITAGSITATEIADNTITNAKLANGSVTSEKIADGAIRTIHIADGAIDMSKLGVDVKQQFQKYDMQFGQVNHRLDTHERGIAISMAAGSIPTVPNKDHQFGVALASFGDSQAVSARYQAKLNKNTAFSLGGGLSEGTGAVNVGLGFGW